MMWVVEGLRAGWAADIVMATQYDQINHDIEPYFALSPAMFQERVKELATTDHT